MGSTSTEEPEITSPVDLCLPDGLQLNPEAKGWSRVPLHNCNLKGKWGRTKKWDYWAILTPDFTISVTYANVDYIGFASIWWHEFGSGQKGGYEPLILLGRGLALPDKPATEALKYEYGSHVVEITDDEKGTLIKAEWVEADGRKGRLEASVELPAGHESVNVVIPWSDTLYQYTSKHTARPCSGVLVVGDTERKFGGAAGEAWGVLDVGRGRWPYNTNWNWGSGAGRSKDGQHTVGIQIGAKWTEGTGFTENGIIVDGKVLKIGTELIWDYDWNDPTKPWRVRHPDGSLDITLNPIYDKHSNTDVYILKMEVHQVFGRWTGHVTSWDGKRVEVDGILGFAEESRSRW
ncbi:hypothetical protein DFJ74DRAFT_321170 [Hyaloraphidium curvatum]|nr:hypothetical protein DFJ74DRAFT_321170 [Hyaloraphidium curvatum]